MKKIKAAIIWTGVFLLFLLANLAVKMKMKFENKRKYTNKHT
jgi:hypothetical protein